MSARGGVLLYDPFEGGHHAEYVGHLIAWAPTLASRERIVVAVPAGMLRAHPEWERAGAVLAPLTVQPAAVSGTRGLFSQPGPLWTQLAAVCREHRPRRVMLLWADTLLLSLALHRRLPGRPGIGALLFRVPAGLPEPRPVREHLRDAAKRALLGRALTHPDLCAAFVLDPRGATTWGGRMCEVPDPTPTLLLSDAERACLRPPVRAKLGVDRARCLMVLFGALDARKGTFALLDAVGRLPAAAAGRLSVCLTGRIPAPQREGLLRAVEDLARASAAQVIVDERYLPDREAEALLSAADVVLAPYLRHVGSSGILLRAAAIGRPVLTQDYGLMGHVTRTHRLGQTVDTTDPDALATALEAAVFAPGAGFDARTAAAFAARQTPEGFARAILGPLLDA